MRHSGRSRGCGRGPVEESILPAIKPSPVQLSTLKRLERLLHERLAACQEYWHGEVVVETVGSLAKGTLLWDKWELDVFVLFRGASERWLKEEAVSVLARCLEGLPTARRYAEHPYLTVVLMGLEADVVPARLVDDPSEARGVERTPFHTRYVKSRLDQCLADDVRLLKAFLKGIKAYGAETHVGGFSGYLAEVLTIHYGGFRGVLEAAARWSPPVYIDPTGSADEDFLRRRYPDSPLIVVDPVDVRRNAAAAVRVDKLAAVTLAAAAYLEDPSPLFFHAPGRRLPAPYTPEPSRVAVILYRGELHEHPPEAVWGRLYRLSNLLASNLERAGFTVARPLFHTDEASWAAILVEVVEEELPRIEYRQGPRAWNIARALRFARKRVREGGYFWVAPDGSLAGLRPRSVRSLADAVRRAVASLPPLQDARVVYAGTLGGLGEPWRSALMGLLEEEYGVWIEPR